MPLLLSNSGAKLSLCTTERVSWISFLPFFSFILMCFMKICVMNRKLFMSRFQENCHQSSFASIQTFVPLGNFFASKRDKMNHIATHWVARVKIFRDAKWNYKFNSTIFHTENVFFSSVVLKNIKNFVIEWKKNLFRYLWVDSLSFFFNPIWSETKAHNKEKVGKNHPRYWDDKLFLSFHNHKFTNLKYWCFSCF